MCHFSMADFQIIFFFNFYHYVSRNRCFHCSCCLGFAKLLKSGSLSLSPNLGSFQLCLLCAMLSVLL